MKTLTIGTPVHFPSDPELRAGRARAPQTSCDQRKWRIYAGKKSKADIIFTVHRISGDLV